MSIHRDRMAYFGERRPDKNEPEFIWHDQLIICEPLKIESYIIMTCAEIAITLGI